MRHNHQYDLTPLPTPSGNTSNITIPEGYMIWYDANTESYEDMEKEYERLGRLLGK